MNSHDSLLYSCFFFSYSQQNYYYTQQQDWKQISQLENILCSFFFFLQSIRRLLKIHFTISPCQECEHLTFQSDGQEKKHSFCLLCFTVFVESHGNQSFVMLQRMQTPLSGSKQLHQLEWTVIPPKCTLWLPCCKHGWSSKAYFLAGS